jgi:F-type H+-transporting ATPase subunit a
MVFGEYVFSWKDLGHDVDCMAIVLVFCFFGVRNLTSGKPGKMQNVLEWIIDFVRGIIKDTMMIMKKGVPCWAIC